MNEDDKHQLEKEQEASGISDEEIAGLRAILEHFPARQILVTQDALWSLLNRLARAEHARDMWRTSFHSIKQE